MAIIEIKIPSPGESITHVELFHWLVKDGDVVKKNTEIAELESDKATLMLIADETGKITFKAKEGDMLEVGSVACTIDTDITTGIESDKGTDKPEPASEEETKAEEVEQTVEKEDKPVANVTEQVVEEKAETKYDNVKVTPLAQKVMNENNLSLDDVIDGIRR